MDRLLGDCSLDVLRRRRSWKWTEFPPDVLPAWAKLLAQHLPAVGYLPPEASFLAWLDCRGLEAADPAQLFLDRGRVGVTSGEDFGEPGSGFVRLNFGTSPDLLQEMVRRIGAAAVRARTADGVPDRAAGE